MDAPIVMTASWERFSDSGKIAANGKPFNPKIFTCATWRFPIGSKLHIVESHNGSAVDVIVTDKPAKRFLNRIDLSPAAFNKLDGLDLGLADVSVKLIKK